MLGIYIVSLILLPASLANSPLAGALVSNPTDYEDLALPGTGSLPLWLEGSLIRTGPGMFEHGGRSVNGVTDGLAKVHAWKISGGNVTYTGKMVRSGLYNKTIQDNYYAPFPVMGDVHPEFSFYEKIKILMGGMTYYDNTNIAVWDLDKGHTVTMSTESPMMNQVDRDTLGMVRSYPSPALKDLGMAMFSAAHISSHPTDGTNFNYILHMDMSFHPNPRYSFYQYISSEEGKVSTKHIGDIPTALSDVRMIHAFGVTPNYIVIPRWNMKFEMSMSDMSHVYMCESIKFDYKSPTYVDVMSIRTGKVHHFELDPARGVHIMNAYERFNSLGQVEIVMDFPTTSNVLAERLNDHCMFDILKIPNLNNPEFMQKELSHNTTLRRFIFNLNTGTSSIKEFPNLWSPTDSLVEFPYINPDYRGVEYCYCYFQQWYFGSMSMDLLKYDVCKEEVVHWHQDNKHVAEPVYVPNPASSKEDDGVIVAPVFDSLTNSTELYVWKAEDLTVLAIYDSLVHVPFTIHGTWFDSN